MPSIVYKFAGPTATLTVSTTPVSTTVSATQGGGEQANFAAFLNTGTTLAAVAIAPSSSGTITAVFPTTLAPNANFVLPPLMQQPMLVAVPANSFFVSAITNSSVAPVIFITPAVAQS